MNAACLHWPTTVDDWLLHCTAGVLHSFDKPSITQNVSTQAPHVHKVVPSSTGSTLPAHGTAACQQILIHSQLSTRILRPLLTPPHQQLAWPTHTPISGTAHLSALAKSIFSHSWAAALSATATCPIDTAQPCFVSSRAARTWPRRALSCACSCCSSARLTA